MTYMHIFGKTDHEDGGYLFLNWLAAASLLLRVLALRGTLLQPSTLRLSGTRTRPRTRSMMHRLLAGRMSMSGPSKRDPVDIGLNARMVGWRGWLTLTLPHAIEVSSRTVHDGRTITDETLLRLRLLLRDLRLHVSLLGHLGHLDLLTLQQGRPGACAWGTHAERTTVALLFKMWLGVGVLLRGICGRVAVRLVLIPAEGVE